MPIHPSLKELYPPNWPEISQRIRFQRARGCCEWCGAAHGRPHPETGSRVILATAHLDHNPANNSEGNLAALCQKCHNSYDVGKRHANRKHRALAAAGQLPLFGSNEGPIPAAGDLHSYTGRMAEVNTRAREVRTRRTMTCVMGE